MIALASGANLYLALALLFVSVVTLAHGAVQERKK